MKVAFDTTLMRPGCVLIAATLGADPRAAHAFKSEDWLLAPTPNMKVYDTSDDELTALVKMVEDHKATALTRPQESD